MILTNEEAFDMIGIYFECMKIATVAAMVCAIQYPQRRHPGSRVFRRLIHRLKTTGNVNLSIFRRRGRGRSEGNTINVLAYVQFNPHLSIRAINRDLGISRITVQRILTGHRIHPYHIVLHQQLVDRDYDRRLDYCNWLLHLVYDDLQLLSRILWSDEATFSSDGTVNKHNMHYWSQNNPRWMEEVQY
ncbi:uncharacterized protein LOC130900442 [Diorhabda carinulata]|uniref:uncharacterized protein LOC130900442 n=1 Tax=Diorhabda carinulata TaxID=1163345 RepID=UPI0025A02A11|nr:uncharacterized protein LOC130900442 [Diorhabda carinulata]